MSNSSPTIDVSVIIPCHNYAHFLPDAVASVVAQTYGAWEIIIVDDGSTDATLSTAQALIAQYPDKRIRLLKQPDRGPATARNTGARYALGEYLLNLDADDMLAPTMLARTTAVLRHHPQVGFVYSGLQLFGQEWHYWPSMPFNSAVLTLENIISPHALVRRAAWQQAGGFDTTMPHYEDWEFWMRVVAAGWQGWHIAEPLVYYRRHSRSMSLSGRSIAYEWDARARIIRRHPQLYGSRLVAWATVYCARRGLPVGQPLPSDDTEVSEIPAPPPAVYPATHLPPALPRPSQQRVPWPRRLIRALPFKLRFRVKCRLTRAQLALRATGLWL
jgi:glycosyltransferase involved in cell wall biosynthesis